MEWFEVTIHTDTRAIDLVTALLIDAGIDCFAVEDREDFAAFLEDTEIYWDYVDEDLMKEKSQQETMFKIYMENSQESFKTLKVVEKSLKELKQRDENNEYGTLELDVGNIRPQEDWENNWKQYFKPFTVGEKFVIKPSWEEYDQSTDRIILEIDPASSFGTGSHDTTQLCMCELEKYIEKESKVLDMGVGSGILSIAAHLLGANNITAVDIDENCIKTAIENGEKNGIRLKTFCGDIVKDKELCDKIGSEYDIIVANIVADVIIAMAKIFKDKLKDNGVLITSGIINTRGDEVQVAIENAGFEILSRTQQNDWIEITAKA